jgi:hypothetical protein
MLHDLPHDDQDPDDPITFINTDIAAAFQEVCRQATFDTLTGKATKSYDNGMVNPGDDIPTIRALWPILGYFKAMRSTACTNRYFDHCGHPHHVQGTTGGQQGDDGVEMTVYSLSQHPIIGRTLARCPRARGVGFADDLTIYATLRTSLKCWTRTRNCATT